MMIEIKGVQFVNKGAELMLQAVLQQMAIHWPEAELVLAPNSNSPYINRAKLGAYQKWSIRKNIIDVNSLSYFAPKSLRAWLKRTWGIVTEADIDLVLDASGFAYGDQWGTLSTQAMCAVVKRQAKHGKKYILLPQAMGPFTREKDIKYLKQALPLASLVCAREETSLAHVKGLIGDVPNLVQFPDFTNLIAGIVPASFTHGERKVLIIPNSNMVSIKNQHAAWHSNYLRVLTDAVQIVRNVGLEPVLLNHEGKGDEYICTQVQQQVGGELTILNEVDPLKIKGIIGASKAVICSRFHGCVSALSQGVPCIGTSWSHKYERLFQEYAQSDSLIAPEISKKQLQVTLEQAIETINAESKKCAREHYKKLSEQMWQKVATLI